MWPRQLVADGHTHPAGSVSLDPISLAPSTASPPRALGSVPTDATYTTRSLSPSVCASGCIQVSASSGVASSGVLTPQLLPLLPPSDAWARPTWDSSGREPSATAGSHPPCTCGTCVTLKAKGRSEELSGALLSVPQPWVNSTVGQGPAARLGSIP